MCARDPAAALHCCRVLIKDMVRSSTGGGLHWIPPLHYMDAGCFGLWHHGMLRCTSRGMILRIIQGQFITLECDIHNGTGGGLRRSNMWQHLRIHCWCTIKLTNTTIITNPISRREISKRYHSMSHTHGVLSIAFAGSSMYAPSHSLPI